MRKKIAMGMVLAALMTMPSITSMAGQWINADGAYWYRNDDGSAYTGWLSSGGKWYFLDRETCYMKTGWVLDGGKWYYCNADGSMYPGGWLEIGKNKYYMYPDGSMASGVFQVGYYRYQTNDDGSIIRNRILNGIRYDEQGCMMVRDEDDDWMYIAPNKDIEFQTKDKLRDAYMNHEYASQRAFETQVKKAFGGIWSDEEIQSFIQELEEEFYKVYESMYNYYRE